MTNDTISIIDTNSLPGVAVVESLISGLVGGAIVKWMLVAGLVMYALFALVIIKQTAIMTETFEEDANGVVRFFAWLHFLMTVILLVVSVLWL